MGVGRERPTEPSPNTLGTQPNHKTVTQKQAVTKKPQIPANNSYHPIGIQSFIWFGYPSKLGPLSPQLGLRKQFFCLFSVRNLALSHLHLDDFYPCFADAVEDVGVGGGIGDQNVDFFDGDHLGEG